MKALKVHMASTASCPSDDRDIARPAPVYSMRLSHQTGYSLRPTCALYPFDVFNTLRYPVRIELVPFPFASYGLDPKFG